MSHPIPDTALDSDIAIIARKGSGKSYLARGLAERLLDLERRVVIVDPLGSWWGLKASADGEGEGYPVAVFGGEHADMPLTHTMGEPLARLIAGENLPCVIDTSLMRKEEQGELAIDLFEGLFRFNKDALTIILEEADVFAPQNPAKDGYAARVLHEVDRIARRGRARGLRLISLTQRPARLHKDVLSQAAALVAMRLTSPHDRAAIEDWIKGNADASQAREVMGSLAELAVGEGWVWAPDLGILERALFPRIRTLDTSATPKAGETRVEPKTLAQVDVAALREALKVDVPATETAKDYAPSKAAIEAAEKRGYDLGWAKGVEKGRLLGFLDGLTRTMEVVSAEIEAWKADTCTIGTSGPNVAVQANPIQFTTTPPIGTMKPETQAAVSEMVAVAAKAVAEPKPAKAVGKTGSDPLADAARQVWPAKLTWAALAAMIGRKARGGHFNATRKRLLETGIVREERNLVVLIDPPTTPAGIIPAALLEANLPQPAAKMFAAIRQRPGITTVVLASVLGMQPRGGHWNSGMSVLRTNGLITEDGGLRVNPDLEGR